MPDRNAWLLSVLVAALIGVLVAGCATDPDPRHPGADLSVLTLNLHTYQELRSAETAESDLTEEMARQRIEAYAPIFDRIAAGINELDPDIVCFQEVGEWSGSAQAGPGATRFGTTDTNMVNQILLRLDERQYFSVMDWSHYGWEVWREGSAILSKFPLTSSDARFISSPGHSRHENWKSRNVPMARIDMPQIGQVTIFSVHAGWWDDPDEPFQDQYRRLLEWSTEYQQPGATTILCGDFNVPAGSQMYRTMMKDSGYSDQYSLANPRGMHDATIGGGADGWEDSNSGKRIDYILMNDDSPLDVLRAKRVFTKHYLGRVSDHVGVYAEFKIR